MMYIRITNVANCDTDIKLRSYLEAVAIPYGSINPLMFAIEEIVNEEEYRNQVYKDLKQKCTIELYNDNDEFIKQF